MDFLSRETRCEFASKDDIRTAVFQATSQKCKNLRLAQIEENPFFTQKDEAMGKKCLSNSSLM